MGFAISYSLLAARQLLVGTRKCPLFSGRVAQQIYHLQYSGHRVTSTVHPKKLEELIYEKYVDHSHQHLSVRGVLEKNERRHFILGLSVPPFVDWSLNGMNVRLLIHRREPSWGKAFRLGRGERVFELPIRHVKRKSIFPY